MFRPVASSLISAAAIAACLTYGVDALNAALSPPTSEPGEQLPNDQTFLRPAPTRAPDQSAHEGDVAISAEVASNYLFAGPFAQWSVFLPPVSAATSGQETRISNRQATAEKDFTRTRPERLPIARPRVEPPTEVKIASASAASSSLEVSKGPWELLHRFFPFSSKSEPPFPPEASGRTAVYDIESHKVYLPTGEILEAHSGLGDRMDDVRYVHEKGRGPTPPNVYVLSLRQSSFHGVQAIRMTPVGGAKMFGRDGLLVHSYMLGPNGQSNGCVSIENYSKFLQAYLNKQVDRLIVVPRASNSSETAGVQQSAPKTAGL